MNHMPFPGFAAFVGDIEFEKTTQFFREIQAPYIILSWKKAVEHDITHGRIGITIIMNIIHGESSFQGRALDEIIFDTRNDGT